MLKVLYCIKLAEGRTTTMTYNFNTPTDRIGTHSIKVDALPAGAPPDALPLWVADMDLPCAEPIIQALHDRVDRKLFGYTRYDNDACKSAITGWYRRRFGWEIAKGDIFYSPGVVPALAFLINCLTKEGDGIIIQKPVYHPFTNKIEANHRNVLNNALIKKGNTYEMDFEDLEVKFADENTRGMILCSPHNPIGRVWTKAELRAVVDIAKRYHKWIISDEIHSDLTRIGITHTPLLALAPDYQEQIIVCTAPSKTFNLAGMQFSNIIIPNKEYQKRWTNLVCGCLGMDVCSPFGLSAIIAAYSEGEEWLDQVRNYIDGNIRYVEEFVKEHLPKAEVTDCQGTYLVWVNLNGYCSDEKKLEKLMQQEGRLALDEGYIFGEEGIGFERINVATPRSNVEECMRRMKRALDTLL